MTAHAAVRLVAAFMIILGFALANLVHPAWIGLTGFVGLNLFQFSFSGFCPALSLLKRAGLQPMASGPELEASRRAQIIVGALVMAIALVGFFAPPPGLMVATVVGVLLALSFGQSAFTGTCPALYLGRRWSRA